MKIKTTTTQPVFNAARTRPHMSVSALPLVGDNSVFSVRSVFGFNGMNNAADARNAVIGSGQPAWSPPV